MKDNIMFSDVTTTDEQSSMEKMIPAEMKITSWDVSLILIIVCMIKVKSNIYKKHKLIFKKKENERKLIN